MRFLVEALHQFRLTHSSLCNSILARTVFGVLLLSLLWTSTTQAQQAPHTTIVVLSDRPMPEGFWPALEAALREDLASDSPETAALIQEIDGASSNPSVSPDLAGSDLDRNLRILRGDQVQPGLAVDQSITVYLHGDCIPGLPNSAEIFNPHRPLTVVGPLGWVKRINGHIEPFIHVECSRIGEMLSTKGFGRSREDRNRLMATGVSNVIVHEWIHIATQSKHHGRHGVTQAEFDIIELLARPSKPRSRAPVEARANSAAPTEQGSEKVKGSR